MSLLNLPSLPQEDWSSWYGEYCYKKRSVILHRDGCSLLWVLSIQACKVFYTDCFRFVTLNAIQTSLPLTTTEALSLLEYTWMSSTPSLEKEAIIIYISGASPLVSKIGNPRKFGYEVTERNVLRPYILLGRVRGIKVSPAISVVLN